jgi:N-acetylglucosamine kinase-like BadF-type ATPase
VPAYQGSRWAAGVDAGGTWVRIRARRHRVVREQRVAAAGAGDGAADEGAAAADGGVAAIVRRAWRDWDIAPDDVGGLVVAARGVWTVGERRRAQNRLRGLARRVRVISDAEAAHAGALGGRAGLLILAGTGSIAIGRDARGRWHRAGGLGPLLGDEGSAFWIGREWLRARSRDGTITALRGALASASPVASIAAHAPGVLRRARRGDRVEREIVRAAQDELAALVAGAGRALRLPAPWPTSWGGSLLARDAWFRAGLARAVARAGLRVQWMEPLETPVRAAERLAWALVDDC